MHRDTEIAPSGTRERRITLDRASLRASASSDPGAPVDAPSRTTLIVLACVLAAAAMFAIRSLLGPLLLGACVAAIVRPWMMAFERRAGGRRRAAAAATAAVVLVLALPLASIAVPLASELRVVLGALRAGDLAPVAGLVEGTRATPPRTLHQLLHAIGPRIADALPSLLGAAAEVALSVFVFVMTLFYVLLDGDAAMRLCRRVSPLAHAHLDALVTEFVEVGRGVLLSVGITSVVEGGAAGIAYFALGLPSAGLLTLLTFIAAMVPIGTILVWGPVAALLWAEGRTVAASVVVFTGLVVISGIDHLARPQLARLARTRLHPLLVFLGMFGGMASLGAPGLFVGPLVLALGLAAVRLYDRDQRARRLALALTTVTQAVPSVPSTSAKKEVAP